MDNNFLGASFGEESSVIFLRVGEPRFCHGLLGAQRASNTAITTDFPLVATNDVAGHGVDMPAKRAQAPVENLLASGNAIVICIHREPGTDNIEARGVFAALKPGNSSGCPFRIRASRCG